MSEMENQTGLSFNSCDDGRVLRDFMALHDPDWFMCGKKVESDYSDEATKAKKLEDDDHPIEFRVAERLSACGIRAVFVDDEVVEFDAAKGLDQVIGLPDLDTGLEIKNVFSAKSKNTISGGWRRRARNRHAAQTRNAGDISNQAPYGAFSCTPAVGGNRRAPPCLPGQAGSYTLEWTRTFRKEPDMADEATEGSSPRVRGTAR